MDNFNKDLLVNRIQVKDFNVIKNGGFINFKYLVILLSQNNLPEEKRIQIKVR